MSAAIQQPSTMRLQLEPARANGMTPLMRAVCDDSVDAVQTLLDSGADVNAKRSDGFTALALAAFFGRTKIVELLLERRADVRVVTRFGTSPEMWAKARGFQEIVNLIQDGQRDHLDVPQTPVTPEDIPQTPVTLDVNIAVVSPPLTAPKTLPEIHDLPPVIAPAFHPGDAFLTRIRSDRSSLVVLTVALIAALGLAIFATYHIRSLLRADVRQTSSTDDSQVAKPQTLVAQPNESQATVSLPDHTQSAPQESRNEEVGTTQTVTPDLPNKTARGPSEESTPPPTLTKPSIKTVSSPRLSHSSLSTVRRDTVIRSEQPKQPAELEIDSKPAPLTVEVNRDRNTNPAPATHPADAPPPQSAPLGITSSKPRNKVIQWP